MPEVLVAFLVSSCIENWASLGWVVFNLGDSLVLGFGSCF